MTGPELRLLKRFDAVRWTRASYVSSNNRRATALVEHGLLEERADPEYRSFGNAAREYRLTVRGAAVVLADAGES